MSHHLQRLAANVLKPGGHIHPVLDPLYRVSTACAVPDFPGGEENVAGAAADIQPAPRKLEPTADPKSPSATSAAAVPQFCAPVGVAGEPAPPHSASDSPKPLLFTPTPSAFPAPSKGDLSETPAGLAPDETPRPLAVTGANSPPTQKKETVTSARWRPSDSPWVDSPFRVPASSAMPMEHLNRAALELARRKDRAVPTQPVGAVARGPDEIQIHIGRIEVTAVPPPAVRANKQRPAAPSLDEYLRRRDRGAQ